MYFRIAQYICTRNNVHALSAIVYENRYKFMEEVHHSVAIGPIFPDYFTLRTISLGERLRLSTLASIYNDTTECLYDYTIWGLLL